MAGEGGDLLDLVSVFGLNGNRIEDREGHQCDEGDVVHELET